MSVWVPPATFTADRLFSLAKWRTILTSLRAALLNRGGSDLDAASIGRDRLAHPYAATVHDLSLSTLHCKATARRIVGTIYVGTDAIIEQVLVTHAWVVYNGAFGLTADGPTVTLHLTHLRGQGRASLLTTGLTLYPLDDAQGQVPKDETASAQDPADPDYTYLHMLSSSTAPALAGNRLSAGDQILVEIEVVLPEGADPDDPDENHVDLIDLNVSAQLVSLQE